jgi:non-specific serine/threonine protein kinase
LLDDSERRLLAWLSVFEGAFELHAVEAVCFSGDASRAIGPLGSLVAKSLVTAKRKPDGSTTYEMLETIAAFGSERLDRSGERDVAREAHGRYFTTLALGESERLHGPDAREALERMLDRLADLRAAFAWAAESDQTATLRLLAEVNQFWLSAGLAHEGVAWAERFLEAFGHAGSVDIGRGLKTAGALALHSRRLDLARDWLDRAVAIGEAHDDRLGVAMALTNLAVLDTEEGELGSALDGYRRALEALPGDADRFLRAIAVGNVGAGLIDVGDFDEALPYVRRQLDISIEIDSPVLRGRALTNIGLCLMMREEMVEAEATMREALEFSKEVDRITAAQTQGWLACIELLTGRIDQAGLDCAAALDLSREVYPAYVRLGLLIAMAIAVEKGEPVIGARLYGAAQAFDTPMGPVEEIVLQPYYDRAVGKLEDVAGDLAFGRTLDVDAAVDEATAVLRS